MLSRKNDKGKYEQRESRCPENHGGSGKAQGNHRTYTGFVETASEEKYETVKHQGENAQHEDAHVTGTRLNPETPAYYYNQDSYGKEKRRPGEPI
jgi:hypothetical protein